MDKLSVAVVLGGASSEHEVSVCSAKSILANIDRERFDVLVVGIAKDGAMYYYEDEQLLAHQTVVTGEGAVPCVISPAVNCKGIFLPEAGKRLPVDVYFPVLHGKNGEDGTIQGLFALSQTPFVGCDTQASADCMDKEVTHTLLEAAGVHMAKWERLTAFDFENEPVRDAQIERIEQTLGYPVFVKPVRAGSSVGVSKASTRAELLAALETALKEDSKVLVEEMIDGQEVECAVLGNERPQASVVGEIEACNEFYDYDAKYIQNDSKLHIPARVSDAATEEIQKTAVHAFRAMGCTGLSRVDFFVRGKTEVILNEINTLPGFTDISMYPKLFDACGIPYSQLITRLIELAQERTAR